MTKAAANDQSQIFTVTELAKRWRCTRKSLMPHIHSGAIASFMIGKRTHRVTLDEVLRVEREGTLAKQQVA